MNLKKYFILLLILISGLLSRAGTSVGNFNRKFQPEFDFRIMYPNNWKLIVNPSFFNESQREAWILTNQENKHESTIKLSFIQDFPAENLSQLTAIVEKRHPGLIFKPLSNPDFVGLTSDQNYEGEGITHNYEYIFVKKRMVVLIENHRDVFSNGAAVLDLILSTVRRASEPATITSVELDKPIGEIYRVGNRFCYIIKVDLLRTDREIQASLKYRASKNHFVKQTNEWDVETGAVKVCSHVDASFDENGLLLTEINLSLGTGAYISCRQANSSLAELLCNSGKQEFTLKQKNRKVLNGAVDKQGPDVKSFDVISDHEFKISVHDKSGIEFVKVNVLLNEGSLASVYLSERDLQNPETGHEFSKKLLTPGFSRVESVLMMDRNGNISVLQAHPTQPNYVYIPNSREVSFLPPPGPREPAVPTNIPVRYFKGSQ